MRRKFVNLWVLVELFRTNLPYSILKTLGSKDKKLSSLPLNLGEDMIDTLIEDLIEINQKYKQVENEKMRAIFKRQMDVLQHRIDTLICEKYDISDDDLHTIV